MNQARVPDALLSVVKQDLRPVRPLAGPARRALALTPLAVVLYVGMPLFWKWQAHVTFAPWPAWIMSGLEIILSLVVLAAAFREAVPGRQLSRGMLYSVIGAAAAGFLLFNSNHQTPAAFTVETWVHWLRGCLYMTISFSIPALIAPAMLVARALPNRPGLTGALYGLAIGLMADAGLRLFCWDGGLTHLLAAHGGAIALLVALGGAGATLVERIKGR